MSVIENPLNQFSSYNYRWKFGLVSIESINNPERYIDSGPELVLIESGGSQNKTTTTYSEDVLGVNVEFFIDDFTAEYLVTPNRASSFSNAIQMEFKVIEPLSVGLFFQILKQGCQDMYGVSRGYLDVPFVLECDFLGYNDIGETVKGIGKHVLALKLLNVTFSVDTSGAVYTVTAIPWNHQAMTDQVQSVPTDIEIQGDTVEAMLQGGEFSLTNVLNTQQQKLEQNASIANNQASFETEAYGGTAVDAQKLSGNRYSILFPASAGVKTPNVNTLSTMRQQRENLAVGSGGVFQFDPATEAFREREAQLAGQSYSSPFDLVPKSPVNISSATASGDVNYLGSSKIVTDFEAFGTIPFGLEADTGPNLAGGSNGAAFEFDAGDTDVAGDEIYRRGSLTIDANTRVFQFPVGTKIEKIIESVLLASEWGLSLINQQPDADGNILWFKIHTESKIRNTDEILNSRDFAYDFTYIVTPYLVDISVIAPAWKDQNYTNKARQAAKVYRYTYTGLNQDIIDFSFNIDNAFYKEIYRNPNGRQDAMSAGGQATVYKHGAYAGNAGTNDGSGDSAFGTKTVTKGTAPSLTGSGGTSGKLDTALLFNEAVLNSSTDMITLDMKIWGDPYYFMDSDVGNWRAQSSSNPNVDSRGRIDPSTGENYVLIEFRTAVDYNGNLLQLDAVNNFSGLYKVITFSNDFSGGLFTQTLNLVRMPNQSNESVANSNKIVDANYKGKLPLVLSNLETESAARSADFDKLVRQANELESQITAFQTQGIQNFEEILQGTDILDIAQNLGGAFNQIAGLQRNLSTVMSVVQGGLPNLARGLATNAINNAIGNTKAGRAINNVVQIKNDIDRIRGSFR